MSATLTPTRSQAKPPLQTSDQLPQFSSRIVRQGLMIIGAGLVLMAGWAGLAPLSGAVIADGVVIADGQRKTVQHQEGGIVQVIHVKDGDKVQAGQALITLDDVRVGADLDAEQGELDAELAKQARLGAERDLANTFRTPPGFAARRTEPRLIDLMQRETTAFTARRHALDEQLGLTHQQIDETQQEIAALASSVETTQAAYRIAQTEYSTNEKLRQQGFISEVKLMELQRNQTDYLAKSQTQQTELAKAREKKTELELKIATLKSDYVRQASEELKDTSSRIYKLQEQIRPLADAARRHVITAPIAGDIVDLKIHTVGSAIGPREPILDIEPAQAHLIVEARIKPENVEDIHVGGEATVRLTAYKQRDSSVLDGTLSYLGADRLTDKVTNQPYCPAHIEIAQRAIDQARKTSGLPIELAAGMSAEVFIKTRDRSAIDYWMEPIVNGARRSMRER